MRKAVQAIRAKIRFFITNLLKKLTLYASDIKTPYFISLWCHLRAGGGPTQPSEIKQFFSGFSPSQE
jgi:hypothetical protein